MDLKFHRSFSDSVKCEFRNNSESFFSQPAAALCHRQVTVVVSPAGRSTFKGISDLWPLTGSCEIHAQCSSFTFHLLTLKSFMSLTFVCVSDVWWVKLMYECLILDVLSLRREVEKFGADAGLYVPYRLQGIVWHFGKNICWDFERRLTPLWCLYGKYKT